MTDNGRDYGTEQHVDNCGVTVCSNFMYPVADNAVLFAIDNEDRANNLHRVGLTPANVVTPNIAQHDVNVMCALVSDLYGDRPDEKRN